MKRALALLALAAFPALTLAGRMFVLADDRGQRHQYAAYSEAPWPAAAAEREQFAQIAAALRQDVNLGVMMIAPDREAMQRAERALSAHLRQKQRRLAIRQQVGPLVPVVLYGRRER
jgi:chlorite dismutase